MKDFVRFYFEYPTSKAADKYWNVNQSQNPLIGFIMVNFLINYIMLYFKCSKVISISEVVYSIKLYRLFICNYIDNNKFSTSYTCLLLSLYQGYFFY